MLDDQLEILLSVYWSAHKIIILIANTQNSPLTLNSIIKLSDAFKISCIRKSYGKWSICSLEQMLHFPLYFQK